MAAHSVRPPDGTRRASRVIDSDAGPGRPEAARRSRPGQSAHACGFQSDIALYLYLGCAAARTCGQRAVWLVVADPVAGLCIAALAAKEGHELWTTEDFCAH